MLPSIVARDLDRDPEQLSLVCVELLEYAKAKAAHDSCDPVRIKAWSGTRMMEIVQEHAAETALKAIEAERAQ